MFGFQTLACLHEIPVIRSSTSKIQDVYSKAKDKSPLIRLPCHFAETVADKSLKIARTVADPLVKPFQRPVNAIDEFAAQKLRQIEAKYPLLTTPTEDVLNTLNEKSEPVRHAMNSVKETTTSTIQHGKETVSHVASATVNKATDVADSVYTFCETHVPGKTISVPRHDFARRTTLLWERIRFQFASLRQYVHQSIRSMILWFRLYLVLILARIKQTNDDILKKLPEKGFLNVLFQRVFIFIGKTFDYFLHRLRPDDRTMAEITKTKQTTTRHSSGKRLQTPQFLNRQTLKPDAFLMSQSVVMTSEETTIVSTSNSDPPNLYPKIFTDINEDLKRFYDKIQPSDLELLYSRLPADIVERLDRGEPLTEEQRLLHAKIMGAEFERQDY